MKMFLVLTNFFGRSHRIGGVARLVHKQKRYSHNTLPNRD